MTRTVFLPLKREPAILFGLTMADLLWVMAGGTLDLVAWRAFHASRDALIIAIALISAASLTMALARMDGTSLPEWLWRALNFWLRPRLYLP